MRLPFLAIVAAVVAFMPVGAALGQTQVYQLNFTSSGTAQLAGGFTWSGPLPANGSYAFAVGGAPIATTAITLNQTPNTSTLSGSLTMPLNVVTLTGTFQMTAATPGTGIANFQVGGAPLANPTFTTGTTTFTNLPNQNDRYAWSAGDVTALKYDLYSGETDLRLALSNSYTISQGFLPGATGTYTIARTGSDSYVLTGEAPPNDGTYAFASDGSPAATPSFTAQGTTFTNLPNQNDSYRVATGRVAAMEYDLAATGKTLGLALDGSYVVQQGSTILESGSYSMAYSGSNVYTLTGNNAVVAAKFANLPNQSDSYTVAGNALTRLKYDLYGGGYNLMLKLDGTYELLDGFTVVDTGSYAIAVPEPTSAAIAAVGAACVIGRRLRRRRSALQGG